MEEDIGSRLSRYPPDCSEVMVGVGGSASVKRGRVYQREGFLFVFICGQIASKCPFLHERCHHQAFAGVHLHGGEEVGEVNLFP